MKHPYFNCLLALTLLTLASFGHLQAATYSVVANFNPSPNGAYPSEPVLATDGNFYGTTENGGASNQGTFYKLSSSGQFTLLSSFNTNTGTNPSDISQGSDGNFYGTAIFGGADNYGTVFKVTPSGTISALHTFYGYDGYYPSGFILGQDGYLYGSLYVTNSSLGEEIVKISTVTGAITILNPGIGFDNGISLYYEGQDGYFYGVFNDTSGNRSIVKVSASGQITTLYAFGSYAFIDLIPGPNNTIYGSTAEHGAYSAGSIFQLTQAGILTTLVSFSPSNPISVPLRIILGIDGNFYGVAQGPASNNPLVETVFEATPSGTITGLSTGGSFGWLMQTPNGDLYWDTGGAGSIQHLSSGVLTTLYAFQANGGSNPAAGLIQAPGGTFYGTCWSGGSSGSGTVFQMSDSGSLTTLATFDQTIGAHPRAPLLLGSDGNFYGTTFYGGATGFGAIYKMTPGGNLTNLASFSYAFGGNPTAGLVQTPDGNFFGTTSYGSSFGYGNIFKLAPGGSLTNFYSFTVGLEDGTYSPVVIGADGNLYGTTLGGGAYNDGSIYSITTAGSFNTLASFNTNLAIPTGGLIQGTDGNFYGTTMYGGTANEGSVFKVTPAGVLTTVASFQLTGYTSGLYPNDGVIQARDGNFYGTTAFGGDSNQGVVFEVTPAGVITTLASLNSINGYGDGFDPTTNNALLQAQDGKLYGTTYQGGAANCGVVYRVSIGSSYQAVFSSAASVPETAYSFTPGATALSLTLNFAPAPGAVLTVVNNTGPSPITGTFTNLPDGGTISASYNGNPYTFTANYEGGDGNDLILTLISGSPAPQTLSPWGKIPSVTYSTTPINITPYLSLAPTASSGLPVKITVKSGPATLSGHYLTTTGTGTVVLVASQPGNADYLPAPEETTKFIIKPAN